MKQTNGHPILPPGIEHISQLPRPGAKSVRNQAEIVAIQEVLKRIVLEPPLQSDAREMLLRVPARELAMCARVWCNLEELRMNKMGYGKPKPVEAKNSNVKRSKGPALSVFTDPTSIVSSPVPSTVSTGVTAPPQENKSQ